MKSLWRVILLSVAFLGGAQISNAQYYSWGTDRASLSWSKINGEGVSIIYPDTVDLVARRMMHYINSVQGDISFDFERGPLEVPFVVHPDNFYSNGMVMWAPLRVEFLSTPSVDSYSMPWIKQLVAHEYRHTVQYNNLNRSTIKIFDYLLGQQGALVSLLFPPLYALEGDAVLMETQMSTYGRGLQPSFAMGYRAMADELLNERDYLRWRCGSYLTKIPDHYVMGYQMMTYAYNKYDENILDKSFEYIARNPQFIAPYSIALRKYYDTSTKELLYESFASLKEMWDSLPEVNPTQRVISAVDSTNYTTYSHPITLESGKILLLKSDYEEPSRFVVFDPVDSSESVVAYTGVVSTRPAYADGRVWWTEYRRSPLFAEDVDSQLCYMDIAKGRTKSLKPYNNALYPTPIGGSSDHIAYVEYAPSGQYSVVEIEDGVELSRIDVSYPNEVHSMAWDNATQALYIIVTGDRGMWIEAQRGDGFEPISEAAYVTISNLRAQEGVLYFGSIASGRDEIHSLDIESGVERQLTESLYGSFQAVPSGSELYMTTYDKWGYHLAQQPIEPYVREVEYSIKPLNLVSLEPKKWSVINLDSVAFDSIELEHSHQEHKSHKYYKGMHLIDVHSWAPVSYDPQNILSEQSLDVGVGATLVSQNLLSSCDGYLSYGWDKSQGSILKGGVSYNGLGVVLDLSATYGGEQNLYLISESATPLKSYRDFSISATLPLYFTRGYHTRVLSPYLGWSYSNGILPTGLSYSYFRNPSTNESQINVKYSDTKEGLSKFSVGVSYADYVQSAMRDLNVPKGYSISAAFAADPTNSEFSKLLSLYGKIYTPGLAQNNSFTLAAAYQNAIGGFDLDGYYPLSYLSSVLVPTGFTYLDISNNNYVAAAAKYQFPLLYPEVGALWNALYFKRLSLGVGANYAQFESFQHQSSSLYSYGVDFMIDLNVISMTSASTSSVTLSLYKPKGKSLYFQFSLGLPIN